MAKLERTMATPANLIQAGARLFARKHYESVRIAALLGEGGVTQGGFSFRFPEGKKTVAEEIIARQDGRFAEIRDVAFADTSIDGLRQGSRRAVLVVLELPETWPLAPLTKRADW